MQLALRRVRFLHSGLNAIGQNIGHPFRQWRPIMAPAPDRHYRNTKRARCCGVTPKGNFEHKIILAAGQPAFEARRGYRIET